ncbi:MAG: hypothetical protein VX498_14995 [Myxococcota bacterium]|nr:hypothetical protein [Myxococcota bacterium]
MDHCHLKWRGYAHAAEALAAGIARQVTGEAQDSRDMSWIEALGRQHGLREDGYEDL